VKAKELELRFKNSEAGLKLKGERNSARELLVAAET